MSKTEKRYKLVVADDDNNKNTCETNRKDSPYSITCVADALNLLYTAISRKVHATILKGILGGFEFSFFQRNLKELVRKAMEMCLRVLKESNKSRIDSYSRQEQCIDHIPYYLPGLSLHVFSHNLSRNSCIKMV